MCVMAKKFSERLRELAIETDKMREQEVTLAEEVLPQYIIDHNDREAWRDVDRQVNALNRQWEKLVSVIEKAADAVRKIESDPNVNLYGE
jgi:hypothetical protein